MSRSIRIENIGPLQRRRRRMLGAWALVAAVAAVGTAWALGAAPWVRLTVSPVFLTGFLGVLQAREHT